MFDPGDRVIDQDKDEAVVVGFNKEEDLLTVRWEFYQGGAVTTHNINTRTFRILQKAPMMKGVIFTLEELTDDPLGQNL